MAEDPFSVLGLQPTASVKEVQHAFRQLAMVKHPDHGGSAVEFDRLLKASREAQVLASDREQVVKQCPTCSGKGWITVQRGFHTTKLECQRCKK